MHKLGVFTWKTVGSSLLCITWKSYSCLCILCFTEMCSAHRGHGNPHPRPPPPSLAVKVVLHHTSTETSKVKERTPFPARFVSEKMQQEKNWVMFFYAPASAGFCMVILTEENRQKCYGYTCQHPDFFFCAIFLSASSPPCSVCDCKLQPLSSWEFCNTSVWIFCSALSSFSLGNTCHFLALISLGL